MEWRGHGNQYGDESMFSSGPDDDASHHPEDWQVFEGQDQPPDPPEDTDRAKQPGEPDSTSDVAREETGRDVDPTTTISQAAQAAGITAVGVTERVLAAFEDYWNNDPGDASFSEILRMHLQDEQNHQGWDVLSDEQFESLAGELERRQWRQEQEHRSLRILDQTPHLGKVTITAAQQVHEQDPPINEGKH